MLWQDIEVWIDTELFCTSCQINSTNKKVRYKNQLKPKARFKWVLWTLFQKHHQMFWQVKLHLVIIFNILVVDACSKIPKLYGVEKLLLKKVIDRLDMFQFIFVKIDEFCWCYLKEFQQRQIGNLPLRSSRTSVKLALFVLSLQLRSIRNKERCIWSHTHLWYMSKFWKLILISH